MRHLVDERLAREVRLGAQRIAQVPGPQRRPAIEQGRDALPAAALVRKVVRLGWHLEDHRRLRRVAGQLSGERVLGVALGRRHVLKEKTLAQQAYATTVP